MTIAAEVLDMPNLPINPRKAAAAPRVSAAKRTAWLVVGWLAFWFGTVVYPCQAHHAPPVALGGPAAIEISFRTHADLDQLDSSPAHEDGTCQELTAPAIATPVTVAATARSLNPDLSAPAAFDVNRLVPAGQAFSTYQASHPPPHTPLFLSTQRLLI